MGALLPAHGKIVVATVVLLKCHGSKFKKVPHAPMHVHNTPHLMRDQVFEIGGYTFFAMGSTSSKDIDDGVLNLTAPDFEEDYWLKRRLR